MTQEEGESYPEGALSYQSIRAWDRIRPNETLNMAFCSSLALVCVLASLNLASSDKIYMKAELRTSSVVQDDCAQDMPSSTDGSGYAALLLDTDDKSLEYRVP